MDQLQNLKAWFTSLQKREQHMLLAMSAVLVITLFYLLIWEPVFSSAAQEKDKLSTQKQILQWMQNAEREVRELRSSGSLLSPQYANQSINSLIERSAISAGVRSSIDKLDSDGTQAMKVQMKSVEFDRLMQWLGKLQDDYGVTPKHVTINKLEKSGMASARMTLEKNTL